MCDTVIAIYACEGCVNIKGTQACLLDHIDMAYLLSVCENFQAETEMVDVSQGKSGMNFSLLLSVASLCESNRLYEAWALQHSALGHL